MTNGKPVITSSHHSASVGISNLPCKGNKSKLTSMSKLESSTTQHHLGQEENIPDLIAITEKSFDPAATHFRGLSPWSPRFSAPEEAPLDLSMKRSSNSSTGGSSTTSREELSTPHQFSGSFSSQERDRDWLETSLSLWHMERIGKKLAKQIFVPISSSS